MFFRAGEMNVPRSVGRNLKKLNFIFNIVKNSARYNIKQLYIYASNALWCSFDFDVELPTIVEDHIEEEEDISPENMGVAQEQADPEDFLGNVDDDDENVAPWMNNPVVVSNIDDNTLQKFIDDNDRVLIIFVDSTYNTFTWQQQT